MDSTWAGSTTSGIFCVIIPSADLQSEALATLMTLLLVKELDAYGSQQEINNNNNKWVVLHPYSDKRGSHTTPYANKKLVASSDTK